MSFEKNHAHAEPVKYLASLRGLDSNTRFLCPNITAQCSEHGPARQQMKSAVRGSMFSGGQDVSHFSLASALIEHDNKIAPLGNRPERPHRTLGSVLSLG
jgi:hypothetical protein